MKVLSIVGSLVCFLIVLYGGWISMWVLARGHIPFGPMIFAILAACAGAALLRGAFGVAAPDTEVEMQLRACQSRFADQFLHLQELVFQRRPGLSEVGYKLSDWTDTFLRLQEARLGSRFAPISLTVIALREADRRIGRVLWIEGTALSKAEQLTALRKARESLDRAEKSLSSAVTTLDADRNGEAQKRPTALGATPTIIIDMGKWSLPPAAQDEDQI